MSVSDYVEGLFDQLIDELFDESANARVLRRLHAAFAGPALGFAFVPLFVTAVVLGVDLVERSELLPPSGMRTRVRRHPLHLGGAELGQLLDASRSPHPVTPQISNQTPSPFLAPRHGIRSPQGSNPPTCRGPRTTRHSHCWEQIAGWFSRDEQVDVRP